MQLPRLLPWQQISRLHCTPLCLFAFLVHLLGLWDVPLLESGVSWAGPPRVGLHPFVAAQDHEIEKPVEQDAPSELPSAWAQIKGENRPQIGPFVRNGTEASVRSSPKKTHSTPVYHEQQQQQGGGRSRGGPSDSHSADDPRGLTAADRGGAAPTNNQQQQQLLVQDAVLRASSSIRLSDLPPVVFSRPPLDLVRITEPLTPPDLASERDSIKKVYPFGVPIEVRSIATGAKYQFVLRSVLGSGGQGIVLLAQDAKAPKLEFALKVFWIQPKRQRGFARDVERLKRRVRLEVALAKSAPADIPLAVWSHLSHIVMPLDVVEPTSNFSTPPEDSTRYWPQWIVFERFAGDLAMLRSLPFASSTAKLSATKQMLMAVVRMHDMGMVHSDIKPQNFFVKADGRIFLGDYSLAHPIDHVAACTEGTATYLPPENLQCIRAKERNIKVTGVKDSWALGTVFFRVWCSGSRPYNVDDLLYDKLLEKLAGVQIEELDFSHCSPDTPVAVLMVPIVYLRVLQHMIRLLLDPDPTLRPKPRDIYERHPVFTMDRKDLLSDTLGGLILTVNTKGLRLP